MVSSLCLECNTQTIKGAYCSVCSFCLFRPRYIKIEGLYDSDYDEFVQNLKGDRNGN